MYFCKTHVSLKLFCVVYSEGGEEVVVGRGRRMIEKYINRLSS